MINVQDHRRPVQSSVPSSVTNRNTVLEPIRTDLGHGGHGPNRITSPVGALLGTLNRRSPPASPSPSAATSRPITPLPPIMPKIVKRQSSGFFPGLGLGWATASSASSTSMPRHSATESTGKYDEGIVQSTVKRDAPHDALKEEHHTDNHSDGDDGPARRRSAWEWLKMQRIPISHGERGLNTSAVSPTLPSPVTPTPPSVTHDIERAPPRRGSSLRTAAPRETVIDPNITAERHHLGEIDSAKNSTPVAVNGHLSGTTGSSPASQQPHSGRKRRTWFSPDASSKEAEFERRKVMELVRNSPCAKKLEDTDDALVEEPFEEQQKEKGPLSVPSNTEPEDDAYSLLPETERHARLRKRNSSIGMRSVMNQENDSDLDQGDIRRRASAANLLEVRSSKIRSARSPPTSFRRIRIKSTDAHSDQSLSPKSPEVPLPIAKPSSRQVSPKNSSKEPDIPPPSAPVAPAAETMLSRNSHQAECSNRRVKVLQARIRDLEVSNREFEESLRTLTNPPSPKPLSDDLAMEVIARRCILQGLDEALLGCCREPTCSKRVRQMALEHFLSNKRFDYAVSLVQGIPLDSNSLEAAFGDLIYVLNKYLCLKFVDEGDSSSAKRVLEGVLRQAVEKEATGKSKSRKEWFLRDLELIAGAVEHRAGNNPYLTMNWEKELREFWQAGWEWGRTQQGPLFARALGEGFCASTDPIDGPSMESMWAGLQERNRLDGILTTANAIPRRRKSGKGRDRTSRLKDRASLVNLRAGNDSDLTMVNHDDPESRDKPLRSTSMTGEIPSVVVNAMDSSSGQSTPLDPQGSSSQRNKSPRASSGSLRKGRRESLATTSPNRNDDSYAPPATTFSFAAELPPVPTNSSSADFTEHASLGPTLSPPQAMDILCLASGEIILATAGDDRRDKRISLWDVRTGTLIRGLDNGSAKGLTGICFVGPNIDDGQWLLSVDMDFSVKLWNWKEGSCERIWKKMHSRIVFQIGVVPLHFGGDDEIDPAEVKGVTCSGDQSIKVFPLLHDASLSANASSTTSIHANAPFTSFAILGSSLQDQRLVASQAYNLRIYRLRTAQLLQTLSFPDLQLDRTPITSISPHPLADNFLLLGCDNEMRLWNQEEEAWVKKWHARDIEGGRRVVGGWSPDGAWVFCGTGSKGCKEEGKAGGGVCLWKVGERKMERVGSGVSVGCCKWSSATDPTTNEVRDILVACGGDGIIRVYM
ncbi:hypothetical protein HDU85_004456 [Gaertneriomyces sp. JEL0708]|nr:hypothetical protein HDU85_004456 [Gaertneriomyces sp. JEL0708]